MIFYFNQMKGIFLKSKRESFFGLLYLGGTIATILIGLFFLSNSIAITSQLPGDGQTLSQEMESNIGDLTGYFGLFLFLVGIIVVCWLIDIINNLILSPRRVQ